MGAGNSLEAVAQQQAADVRALVLRGRPGALARFLASTPPDVIASYFNLLADDARSKAAAKLDELARTAPDLHVGIAIARVAARLPLNNDALAARIRGPSTTTTVAAEDRIAEMSVSLADARVEIARIRAEGDRLRAELSSVASGAAAVAGDALTVAVTEEAAGGKIPDAPPGVIFLGNEDRTAIFGARNSRTGVVTQLGHAIPVPLGPDGKPLPIAIAPIETKEQMNALLAAPTNPAVVMSALKTAEACNAEAEFIWDPNLNSCAIRTPLNTRLFERRGLKPVPPRVVKPAEPTLLELIQQRNAARRGAIAP